MRISLIAWILALLAMLGLLSGCAKEDPATDPSTSTTTTASAKPDPQPITVEHDHCGLYLKLDSEFQVGLMEDDKNTLTFSNNKISGSVTFGTLEALGNGAANSKAYADALQQSYGEDKAWVGTGTGFGYYVVSRNDDITLVECLYIHGTSAWLVKAQATGTELTEQMTKIVGRCGLNADEIPV